MGLKNKISLSLAFLLMVIGLILMILIAATLGSADLSILESLQIMINKIPFLGKVFPIEIEQKYVTIVMDIRMPRILLACLVGMGLASVGCAFQGMFKNPMADPYVLGVSSGAALGATLGIVLSRTSIMSTGVLINLLAFVGAILTTLAVYSIARVGNKVPTINLLLAGIAISFFMQSCISILMIFNHEQVEDIIFWTMGSVSTATWQQIVIVFPIVMAGVIVIYSYSRDLNAMLLGEDHAKNLGVHVEKVKKIMLGLCSFLVAVFVTASGIIGFVGLIVPHAVRLVIGPNHKVLIPFSVIGGGMFLVLCDTLARTIASPMELPVGAVTAVFGSPYFIYLLYQRKKKV